MPRKTREVADDYKFRKERGSGSFKEYVGQMLRQKFFGPDLFMFPVEDRYNSGYADEQGTYKGHTIYIELKIPGGRVSPLQKRFLDEARKAGATVGVAWNWGQFKAIIQEAIDRVEKNQEEP
jgi:hypothetical protein